MTRKEAYAEIKNLDLQDLIKEITGKNYTNVSTDELVSIVNDYNSKSSITVDNNVPTDTTSTTTTTPKRVVTVMVDGSTTLRLIEVLRKKNILLESEQNYILGLS